MISCCISLAVIQMRLNILSESPAQVIKSFDSLAQCYRHILRYLFLHMKDPSLFVAVPRITQYG